MKCSVLCLAVASTEMTVQNLEEKAELNDTIERLKVQFAAVSANLEVQAADNSQLSRSVVLAPCLAFSSRLLHVCYLV